MNMTDHRNDTPAYKKQPRSDRSVLKIGSTGHGPDKPKRQHDPEKNWHFIAASYSWAFVVVCLDCFNWNRLE